MIIGLTKVAAEGGAIFDLNGWGTRGGVNGWTNTPSWFSPALGVKALAQVGVSGIRAREGRD